MAVSSSTLTAGRLISAGGLINAGGQISAATLVKVRPGDLITADFFNGFIDVLNDLAARVAALEAGSVTSKTVVITSITSATNPIRVGTHITVHGASFIQPASLNAVTVGGIAVPSGGFGFDSSDTVLSFDVPAVPELPAGGQSVLVTVSNANGSASRDIVLLPILIVPAGRVEVAYTAAPVGTIVAGQSFVFTFEIHAIVDHDATYSVLPSITGATGWTATLLDDSSDQARTIGGVAPVSSVAIAAGARKTLRVRVAIPAGLPPGTATLRVDVTSAVAGTNIQPGSSSPIALAIGAPPPVPDNRVTISLSTTLPIQNGKVVVPRNAGTGVQFNLLFSETADYTITPTLRTPAGWVAPQASTTLIKPKITNNVPVNATVTIALSPGAGAGDSDLVLTITGTNGFQGEYDLPLTISG